MDPGVVNITPVKNKGKEKVIENDENFNFDESEKSFNNKNFSKIEQNFLKSNWSK